MTPKARNPDKSGMPYKEEKKRKIMKGHEPPEGDMKWADPFYDPFREAWNEVYKPADYEGERKPADFIQLAKTRSKHNGTLTDENWRLAITHYFKTPQSSHSLGDLASRFVVFLKGPLDRFGKPTENRNVNQRIVGQASTQVGKYDHLGGSRRVG
jgi:hypothetical protein